MDDVIQPLLDHIDATLAEPMTLGTLAERAGYSPFHFARMFTEATGMPVMAYVTLRRLQFARYRLSRGAKVIDAAMDCGFLTHAGFTKAFRRCFGHPPSLCPLHIDITPPGRATPQAVREWIQGGNTMQLHPHIIEWTPFWAAGYPTRQALPGIQSMGDAPAYWNTVMMNTSEMPEKAYEPFSLSKHFDTDHRLKTQHLRGSFPALPRRRQPA